MQVKEIMTKKVVTVKPQMSVHEVAELFVAKDISGAPVVAKDGRLLGIVQEEGIIFQDKKVHLPTVITIAMGFITLGLKRFEEEMKKITANAVEEIMEREVAVVSPEATIEDLATLMIEKRVYYFPVLKNGKLVGVVTKKDIVRAIARTDS